jgi:hypothetical protein
VKLKSTSKTVICVDADDLMRFVTECYGLARYLEFTGSDNGDTRLFDVHPRAYNAGHIFCGHDMDNAKFVIRQPEIEYWNDIGAILARLAFDGHLPQGNYLVEHSW